MAEKFAPLGAGALLAWILAEEKRGQVFGIHSELFFRSRATDPFRLKRFGHVLETPLGVAAGPHTQLAQNIVAAWLCGARFIELKTVQTLDRLEVRKPCIAVSGAGFNCEWSQELTLDESFDQYLGAWVLLHALKHRLKGPFRGDPGFIFNFSVGYDLAGIMQPNMQRFLDRISMCRAEKEALLLELEPLFPAIADIDISECISDSVTLSTMHGCPPEEIEKIAMYLLDERKLHTTVKLNPTLLGAEALRGLLNGAPGLEGAGARPGLRPRPEIRRRPGPAPPPAGLRRQERPHLRRQAEQHPGMPERPRPAARGGKDGLHERAGRSSRWRSPWRGACRTISKASWTSRSPAARTPSTPPSSWPAA